MIQFEKEIIEFLGLPSIPRKEWDKEKAFDKGVAVLELQDGQEAYAVCSCTDGKPVVTKVFGFALWNIRRAVRNDPYHPCHLLPAA